MKTAHLFALGKLLILLLALSPLKAQAQEAVTDTLPKHRVRVVKLQQEVNSASWLEIDKGFAQAEQEGAELIVLHMNTYGGEVVYADSIRTRILNENLPVYVFVDNNAASAGALISIACDRIYMRPGATIGASTVVDQTGAAAPDKYQSYMRAMIRATAEAQGKDTLIQGKDTLIRWHRDPAIAEAMVDPEVCVVGIIDSGKVLTFTATEAMRHGYCDAMADSVVQIVSDCWPLSQTEIRTFEPNFGDRLKGRLMGTALRALLIMLMVAGIWFELQSPGMGFPGIMALAAAVLYFAPLYLDGLVQYWEIIVFLLGVLLLVLEWLVIPGFGVCGISGILCMMTGLTFALVGKVSFQPGQFHFGDFDSAFLTVLLSMLVGMGLCLWLGSRIGKGKGFFRKVALTRVQDNEEGFVAVEAASIQPLEGREGISSTILRPSGKIRIDGVLHDAVAEFGYIEAGRPVKVSRVENAQLYVREISLPSNDKTEL